MISQSGLYSELTTFPLLGPLGQDDDDCDDSVYSVCLMAILNFFYGYDFLINVMKYLDLTCLICQKSHYIMT